MNKTGRNLTPPDLRAAERKPLIEVCHRYLVEVVRLLGCSIIVGVGKFAQREAKAALDEAGIRGIKVESIMHPSPANPAANRGWEDVVHRELEELDILRFLGPGPKPKPPEEPEGNQSKDSKDGITGSASTTSSSTTANESHGQAGSSAATQDTSSNQSQGTPGTPSGQPEVKSEPQNTSQQPQSHDSNNPPVSTAGSIQQNGSGSNGSQQQQGQVPQPPPQQQQAPDPQQQPVVPKTEPGVTGESTSNCQGNGTGHNGTVGLSPPQMGGSHSQQQQQPPGVAGSNVSNMQPTGGPGSVPPGTPTATMAPSTPGVQQQQGLPSMPHPATPQQQPPQQQPPAISSPHTAAAAMPSPADNSSHYHQRAPSEPQSHGIHANNMQQQQHTNSNHMPQQHSNNPHGNGVHGSYGVTTPTDHMTAGHPGNPHGNLHHPGNPHGNPHMGSHNPLYPQYPSHHPTPQHNSTPQYHHGNGPIGYPSEASQYPHGGAIPKWGPGIAPPWGYWLATLG